MIYSLGNAVYLDQPYAFSWFGVKENDRTISAVLEMKNLHTINDFMRTVQQFDGLVASLVFASVYSHLY